MDDAPRSSNQLQSGVPAHHRFGWPEAVIVGVICSLAIAHLAVVLIDVANVAGLGDVIGERSGAAAWVHIFGEANPIEWVQWALIGALIVVAARQSGESDPRSDRPARAFWLLVAVGATMMLMEDAGNVRHRLVDWAEMSGVIDADGLMNLAVEAAWFAAIAAVFGWAALAHGRRIGFPQKTLIYGSAGVAFYAVAVVSSATRDLGDWYQRAGAAAVANVYGGNLELPRGWDVAEAHHVFMDFVYEESLELLGAGFLLAAALAFRGPSTTSRWTSDDPSGRGP